MSEKTRNKLSKIYRCEKADLAKNTYSVTTELDMTDPRSSEKAWNFACDLIFTPFRSHFEKEELLEIKKTFIRFYKESECIISSTTETGDFESLAMFKHTDPKNLHIGFVGVSPEASLDKRRAVKNNWIEYLLNSKYDSFTCKINDFNEKSINYFSKLGFSPISV